MEVTAIGEKCECAVCGKIFFAELRPAENIVQKLSLPEPDSNSSTTAEENSDRPRQGVPTFTAQFFHTIGCITG